MAKKTTDEIDGVVVLIIEDDTMIQGVLQSAFAEHDFDTNVLGNGHELEDTIEGKQPEVIILDLVFSTRDGFEILDVIKNHSEWNTIPVIVFSNMSEPHIKERAMKAGAEAFLVKAETSLSQLIKEVKKAAKKL